MSATLKVSNTTILKGIFPDDFRDQMKDKSYKFCHIDVDVYSSAKDVFDYIWPNMTVGGVVVFDDCGFHGCDGVTKLFNDINVPNGFKTYNLNGHEYYFKKQRFKIQLVVTAENNFIFESILQLMDISEVLSESAFNNRYKINSNLLSDFPKRPIVVFGSGNLGKKIAAFLLSKKFDLKAFSDNNKSKWGESINNIPIISPEKAAELYGANALFIVSIWSPANSYVKTKRKQPLASLGIKRISYTPLLPCSYSLRNCYPIIIFRHRPIFLSIKKR